MNWLTLMKQVPPEILQELENIDDLQRFVPHVQQLFRFYKLAVATPMGGLGPDNVQQLIGVFGVELNERQRGVLADALQRFCPDPDANVVTFLRDGGLKQILAGIATPHQNMDTDNAIRCPHCSGLIVRPESASGFDDLLRCQHCGGLILNN